MSESKVHGQPKQVPRPDNAVLRIYGPALAEFPSDSLGRAYRNRRGLPPSQVLKDVESEAWREFARNVPFVQKAFPLKERVDAPLEEKTTIIVDLSVRGEIRKLPKERKVELVDILETKVLEKTFPVSFDSTGQKVIDFDEINSNLADLPALQRQIVRAKHLNGKSLHDLASEITFHPISKKPLTFEDIERYYQETIIELALRKDLLSPHDLTN